MKILGYLINTFFHANNSDSLITLPLGLQGEEKMIILVLGVMAASNCSALTLKSLSTVLEISTGTPPAYSINEG